MLQSMTGFGRAIKNFKDKCITVEIKSLNGKYMDLNLRMPSVYKEKEIILRKKITDVLVLGKVELTISVNKNNSSENGFSINKELAKSYFNQLTALCDELKISREDLLSKILRMPDVIAVEQEQNFDEEEWNTVYETILEAVKSLNVFRTTEGAILENDLLMRVKKIVQWLNEIKNNEKKRIIHIKGRIHHNLAEFIGKDKIDSNRFEQEMIYFLEKLDITEEVVRLKSHCDYFTNTAKENISSKGKKLGFIVQEIGREINTIGSKANDATIQKLVVNMKDELEKIKEQLNNVL